MKLIRLSVLSVVCFGLSGCMTIGVAQLGHGVRETDQKGDVQKDDQGKVIWVVEPHPIYYALIPLTVPVDVAFVPITLPLFFAMRDVH
jgi:hypothetical protein